MDGIEPSCKKQKWDHASSMDNGNNYLNFGEGEIRETCESKPETECGYQAMDRKKNPVLTGQSDEVLPNITSPALNASPGKDTYLMIIKCLSIALLMA